jgi:hypothetical protein
LPIAISSTGVITILEDMYLAINVIRQVMTSATTPNALGTDAMNPAIGGGRLAPITLALPTGVFS